MKSHLIGSIHFQHSSCMKLQKHRKNPIFPPCFKHFKHDPSCSARWFTIQIFKQGYKQSLLSETEVDPTVLVLDILQVKVQLRSMLSGSIWSQKNRKESLSWLQQILLRNNHLWKCAPPEFLYLWQPEVEMAWYCYCLVITLLLQYWWWNSLKAWLDKTWNSSLSR